MTDDERSPPEENRSGAHRSPQIHPPCKIAPAMPLEPRTQGGSSATSDLVPLEEEQAVVHRLRQGEREAVAQLYGWYGDRLYRQAILPRLPIRELAEDCLRDTFRTALEKIEYFNYDNRSIFFWLRRIAINKATDVHRRHQRDRKLEDKVKADPTAGMPSGPPRPDRGLEIEDTRRLVEASLDKLNPRYAHVLRLRLIEERSREEAAEILGVTVGNLDVILHRACKAFRNNYPP